MNKKNNLFIDICQSQCNIAVFDNQKILKKCSWISNNNITDLIVKKIEKIIKNKNICAVYVINGPGSFTGERVACLIAKTWYLIKNVDIFLMDSLSFQLNDLNGISVINAKTNFFYLSVYDQKKCLIKPKIVFKSEFEKIIKKFNYLEVFRDYINIDVFKNILNLSKYFKKATKLNEITPLYLKKAVYDKKNN